MGENFQTGEGEKAKQRCLLAGEGALVCLKRVHMSLPQQSQELATESTLEDSPC